MYMMMDFMRMLSRLILIHCGGTGVSTIHGVGDGIHHGIIVIGAVQVIGMVLIGIILIGIIHITILIMDGVV